MAQNIQQFDQQINEINSFNAEILRLADDEKWDAVSTLTNERDKKIQSIFPIDFDMDEQTSENVRSNIQALLRSNDEIIKQARGIRVKFMNEKILFNQTQKAIKAYQKARS